MLLNSSERLCFFKPKKLFLRISHGVNKFNISLLIAVLIF